VPSRFTSTRPPGGSARETWTVAGHDSHRDDATRDPAAVPAAWSLPVTFFCLRHCQALASRCPHCGRKPARPPWPALSRPACCGGQDGCGGRLDAATSPPGTDVPAARGTQGAVSRMLVRVRDPAGTAASRRSALDSLTGLAVIAFHLAVGGDRLPQAAWPTPDMLDVVTIPAALALLAGHRDDRRPDPLADLAARIPDDAAPTAVPKTWGRASPALRARVAHSRDAHIPAIDRLRHATALPGPHVPGPRPRRVAQVELSLTVVSEMGGELQAAARGYARLAGDERLSDRDRARSRLWIGTALSKDGEHAHATSVMTAAAREFEDLGEAEDWSVAHQKLALAYRGAGNLTEAQRLITIAGASGTTGTPMQKVRLSTAQAHILLSGTGTGTGAQGLILLDETARLALDNGLSHQLRSIESIRTDALAEAR
jgi:hypothetical protein